MFEAKSDKQSSDGAYLGSSLTKPASRPSLSLCPTCGATVLGLAAHMQYAHGPKPVKKKIAPRDSKPTNSYRILLEPPAPQSAKKLPRRQEDVDPTRHVCVVCGVLVKSLAKHFNRTGHSPAGGPSKQSGLRVRAPANGALSGLKCQKCGSRFPNATQLALHVLGSHGRQAYDQMNVQAHLPSERSSGNTHVAQDKDMHAPDSASQEQRLDAKRYWGHSFRDHGQFGSYPSHDDMDDES